MSEHNEGCDCAECHEAGWANKWRVAIDMAARESLRADDMRALSIQLAASLRKIVTGWGHEPDDSCQCEDCEYLRPIYALLAKADEMTGR